jgi:carbohydrate-binding DOMON domain-containing protein
MRYKYILVLRFELKIGCITIFSISKVPKLLYIQRCQYINYANQESKYQMKQKHISTTPKAFNINNPVQAKHSTGSEILRKQELRSSSTPSELVELTYVHTPSCASLARGYSY